MNDAGSLGHLKKVTDVVPSGTEHAEPSGSASKIDDCANIPDRQGLIRHCGIQPASNLAQRRANNDVQDGSLSGSSSKIPISSGAIFPIRANEPEVNVGRIGMNNIDLNNVYDDSQENVDNFERPLVLKNPANSSLHSSVRVSESHKSSPPQGSGNSDSTSSESPSTSSGEAQVHI